MATITIDHDYGYVILTAISTFILNTLHTLNTGDLRKAAQVNYPAAYAEGSPKPGSPAFKFNCAQRAHSNYIENHTSAVGCLLLAGLAFPKTAAGMGMAWCVCRWLYMKGYSEGAEGGMGRYKGVAHWGFQAGLAGLAGWVGLAMVMGW